MWCFLFVCLFVCLFVWGYSYHFSSILILCGTELDGTDRWSRYTALSFLWISTVFVLIKADKE